MCPLIWCRKTFKTNELAIRHVVDCPRLLNAWYWCPFHRRPERFLECNKGCEIVPKPKMHHAVWFFNWFGRRRSLKRQGRKPSVNLSLAYSDLFVQREPKSRWRWMDFMRQTRVKNLRRSLRAIKDMNRQDMIHHWRVGDIVPGWRVG